MPYKILVVAFFLTSNLLFSQETATVEKSIFGIQTGFLGVWAHNESRLANDLALRSEIGFNAGIFGGDFYNEDGFVLAPSLIVEPRYYYNLQRRVDKDRNIEKNSANFFALRIGYQPDWFTLTNVDRNIEVAESIAFIPKWGLKRTVLEHLTYEVGIGFGYRYYFLKQYGYLENRGEAALDLHLQIGYTF